MSKNVKHEAKIQSAAESTADQISASKEMFVDRAQRVINLRNREREFHGLKREFQYLQADITNDYNKSADVKHPRDVGDIRESILRSFLTDSGYLPKRYAVLKQASEPSQHPARQVVS